ncbi:dihydrolipoamide acetyltransferase family protein [Sphingobium fuliginis]|uniref:Dihydrolipoamide acetyltransferase component of pyruvate dehydrogenase complex n=1 Tax=Sphingobium fuliginis ATCC 27551 TaxID=1208342 RepID=A0A5B8CE22_SPHSA|nr:dihydrolipoamide acetyltransferase family protein [Sphingobium fuliginis]QDC37774.1 2-oxo acid dehydrogenase subunit E2 [Sphingobium fuliginis ATCC 27551]
MPLELKMPALSPTMEKGTLARWLVKPGDGVRPGDPIAEVETDKATMEIEAVEAGQVATLLVEEGSEDIAVGTVIALISAEDEAGGAADDAISAPALAEAEAAIAGPTEEAPVLQEVSRVAKPPRLSPADRIKVSPLASRIAKAKGISLASVKGSGPNGRIVRADLGIGFPAAAMSSLLVPVPPAPSIPQMAAPPEGVPVMSEKLSALRKTIARRLTEAKRIVPHFYLTARCNLDPLLALRRKLNAELDTRGVKLSVNDLLMKALACALIDVPDANVQFGEDVLHRFGRVDVSMAVAIDGGLVTPVLHDVGALSLSSIATQSKALAEKARAGKLIPEDYQGGTVTLSNLGMYGIDEMFPVINPPQALIIGAAAGVRQPWNVAGEIAMATIMAATASFDHRAIDGATAAQFMAALRDRIEAPLLLAA